MEEAVISCSTVFFNDGPYIDKGLYIHLCRDDVYNWFRVGINIPTAISVAPSGTEFIISFIEHIKKIILKLPGRAYLGVIGNLLTLLALAMAFTYIVAYNKYDGSLDVFISEEALLLIPLALGPVPIPIPIRIGKYDMLLFL